MATLVNAFDRNTWNDEEEAYFAYVDRVVARGKDERFSNGKPWHAAYLIFKFLRHATRHVRLLSGTLTQTTPAGVAVYGAPRIIEAACHFLKRRGSKLHVALEEKLDIPGEDTNEHPLIADVSRLKKLGLLQGTLEVRKMESEVARSWREQGILYHMMLMDDRGWRLEVDPDPNNVKAIVNAKNVTEASALCSAFDASIWSHGTTIARIEPNTPNAEP